MPLVGGSNSSSSSSKSHASWRLTCPGDQVLVRIKGWCALDTSLPAGLNSAGRLDILFQGVSVLMQVEMKDAYLSKSCASASERSVSSTCTVSGDHSSTIRAVIPGGF